MRREYRPFLWTWLALMILLGLTLSSAYVPMGIWNSVANLGIALAKAALVTLVFMHLKRSSGVIRIYAGVGLFTLALLFTLSGSDYATRERYGAPWQAPPPTPSERLVK